MSFTHEQTVKRLRYRSWRRGTRELDLLLGRFADAALDSMDDGQLRRFGRLLDRPDPDIHDWIVGGRPPPPEHRGDVLDLLIEFNKNE